MTIVPESIALNACLAGASVQRAKTSNRSESSMAVNGSILTASDARRVAGSMNCMLCAFGCRA